MDKYYSIKEVSEQTGLSSSNIRFYEKEGLIKNILRNKNGVRLFKESEIGMISFLAKLKEMEMPIPKMKQYADLREKGEITIIERIGILENHKEFLNDKIQRLNIDMDLLNHKINCYQEAVKNNEK